MHDEKKSGNTIAANITLPHCEDFLTQFITKCLTDRSLWRCWKLSKIRVRFKQEFP